MMMQEHDDNLFTKEKSDLERYLLRITQRYFEIENVNSQISVENIIVESIRRLKQDLYDNTDFIFSFNNQTGHINVTIQTFGGEYAFDKNSAFNKDFGEQADTICQGNDKRLSNKREPLDHIHDIGDITDLRESLDRLVTELQNVHYHRNSNILDILTYTGIQQQIDLIVIDDLLNKVSTYYTGLEQINLELKAEHNNDKDELGRALIATNRNLTSIKDFINQSYVWTTTMRRTIQEKVIKYTQDNIDSLTPYLRITQVNDLVDFMNKAYRVIDSGERNIMSLFHSFEHHGAYTTVVSTNIITQVVNGRAKLYFKYDDNGETITLPLPYMMKIPNGFCYIQGCQDDNGEIYIETKLITDVQARINAGNMYQGNTVMFASQESLDYMSLMNKLNAEKMRLPVITSATQALMTSIIPDNHLYLINAFKDPDLDEWYTRTEDGNEILLPYTSSSFIGTHGCHVCIDRNGDLHRIDAISESVKYIAEYDIPMFENYFTAPRIYYQVYKEGI